eukprot:SAG11_NODE_14854_length_597_cov_1.453815_2_plen_40_part_01
MQAIEDGAKGLAWLFVMVLPAELAAAIHPTSGALALLGMG